MDCKSLTKFTSAFQFTHQVLKDIMKNFIVFSILILKLNFIINQPTITKTYFDNDGSVTIQWNPNRDTSNKTRYKIEVTDNSAQNSAYEWPGIIINLVLNFSNQLYQFLAQITFVEFDECFPAY